MNQTTELFIAELKTKPLDTYTLKELQEHLQRTIDLYRRFKGEEERDILNIVWNKMAEQYNTLLKQKYPAARDVYKMDYIKNEVR